MRNLVIGGSGFIGQHIAKLLAESGEHVTIYDRVQSDAVNNYNFQFIKGDIVDAKNVFESMKDVDHVYAIAGLLGTSELYAAPNASVRTNIEGHINILEAAVKLGGKRIFFPATPYVWRNIYSITKHCGEELYKAYSAAYSLDTRVVRLWNVYGSFQKWEPVKKVVPEFVISALTNSPIEIYGDGKGELHLVNVLDVASLIVKFMNVSGKFIETYDMRKIATRCSVLELANIIIEMTDSKSEIMFLPKRFGEFENNYELTGPDVSDIFPCQNRTDLYKGLNSTIQFYKKEFGKQKTQRRGDAP